jgi:hypothetical protein
MKKKNKPLFYLIKILDIFYVSNLYLILGVISSNLINQYMITDYNSSRGYLVNFIYLLLLVSYISLAVFIIRQLIKFYIPFPLDGIAGYKHKYLKEINGNVVLAFAFLLHLKDPLYQYSRILYNIS